MKLVLILSLLLGLSAFADDNTVQPTPSDNGKKSEDLKGDIKGTGSKGKAKAKKKPKQ